MLNFLPQQEKKQLISEYRVRFGIVISIFIIALFIIASIGLLPAYLNKKAESDAAREEQQKANEGTTPVSYEEAQAQADMNKQLADYIETRINATKETAPLSSIMKRVFDKTGENISIRAIEKSDNTLIIQGVATTRSELIAFQQRLRQEKDFKSAVLPISDIAQSVNPAFAIQITLPKSI